MYRGVNMLSKPASGKQLTPQPLPLNLEIAPYRCIWSPILSAYALDWLGTMPQASKYAFLRQWSSLKPLKCSSGAGMMVMNLASLSEHFEGFRPAHCRRKAFLFARGIVPSSIKRIVLGFLALKVALGGHFWRRQPWWCRCCWPLAVGHWSLGAFAGMNSTK